MDSLYLKRAGVVPRQINFWFVSQERRFRRATTAACRARLGARAANITCVTDATYRPTPAVAVSL